MVKKAEEVIEEYGLGYRIALDAISNFYDVEFVVEELCKMIDEYGRSEDFAEYIEDNFGNRFGRGIENVIEKTPATSA